MRYLRITRETLPAGGANTRRGGREVFMKEERVPVANDQFLQEVAQLFVGQSRRVSEGLGMVEQCIINAAEKYDDELAVQWLGILEEIVTKTLPPVNDVSLNDFGKRLQNLYWHLPQVKRVPFPPAGDAVYYATLLKAKEWILRRVIKNWCPQKIPASIETFRFLLAVYAPTKERLELCRAPEAVIQEAEGTNREIKTIVIDLVREHTDAAFGPVFIEEWLSAEDVPSEIAEVLLHAWARNGGWLLMQRHLRNKKILEPFKPEERSEWAYRFFMNLGGQVATLETDIGRLSATIPGELWQCAKLIYNRFDNLLLIFDLRERRSFEEATKLYNQTYMSIREWIERQKKERGKKFSVQLDFQISHETMPQYRRTEILLSG